MQLQLLVLNDAISPFIFVLNTQPEEFCFNSRQVNEIKTRT